MMQFIRFPTIKKIAGGVRRGRNCYVKVHAARRLYERPTDNHPTFRNFADLFTFCFSHFRR